MKKAMARKEEVSMQTQVTPPAIPLPFNEAKRLIQAEVNQELWEAVEREMAKRKVKIRQIMEWGLRGYLLETNPKEAEKLGIRKNGK